MLVAWYHCAPEGPTKVLAKGPAKGHAKGPAAVRMT